MVDKQNFKILSKIEPFQQHSLVKKLITCFISLFILFSYSYSQTILKDNKGIYEILKIKLTVVENSKEGSRYKIYSFSKKKFHIYDQPFDGEIYKDHLYASHKFNSSKLFRDISKLSLDTLKESYYNNCTDPTSGYDYFLLIETRSMSVSITLHHYYIEQVGDLINLLNKYLPRTFQIEYLTKENKQDCNKQN